MILIADGGSTKVDWVLLNENKKVEKRLNSKGINPSILSKQDILERLNENSDLSSIKEKVKEIYFYGAGCGSVEQSKNLDEAFADFFTNASRNIKEDTYAAVYATSPNEKGIVCIIGTGSNSCFYDGKLVRNNIPSLGYILMDEGSGNHLGKILLQDYSYKKMPSTLRKQFEDEFDLNIDVIKDNLYKKENPNQYLASFAKFLLSHSNTEYIKAIIKKAFTDFINNKVLTYCLLYTSPSPRDA